MPDLLIVADDLTGATDTGVQFARRGIPVRVSVDRGEAFGAPGEDAAVLVVDTQSRHLEPGEAARRVTEVVRRGREAGIQRFFKKTDSGLRGNVGSELQALLSASGCSRLAFVPALPAQGRTTRGGVQLVHGRRLHETDFADDPLDPVRESSVAALIRRQADVPVVSLPADSLEGGIGAVIPGSGILVLDAETDEEIRRIVDRLGEHGLLGAVAGTAALARALADSLPGFSAEAAPPFRPPASVEPMLVVGGSLDPVSLGQMDHAGRSGFATVLLSAGTEEPVAAAIHHLSRGRSVLLRTATGRAEVEACVAFSEQLGLPGRELHLRVAESTGHVVASILREQRVGVLMVLGGDTLAGVIRALGYPALLPRQEILPGVPVSELTGDLPTLLVTKAGGFGTEAALTQIRRRLNRTRNE